MNTERSMPPRQDLAVEFLANEMQVPISEVARLYGRELSRLTIDAQITGFLPIFAIRNVRKLLVLRRTGISLAVLVPLS
jgi:hypothetical protein